MVQFLSGGSDMKEVPFLSKMVYKGLGFGTRGRSPRIILLCWVTPLPPPPSALFPCPLREENRTFKAFLNPITDSFKLNLFYFFSTRGKVILEPIILSCGCGWRWYFRIVHGRDTHAKEERTWRVFVWKGFEVRRKKLWRRLQKSSKRQPK